MATSWLTVAELKDRFGVDRVSALASDSELEAAILDAEEQWIQNLIQTIFETVIVFEKQGRIGFDIEQLNQQPIAVRRRLIRMAVLKAKGNLRRLAFAHVEAAVKFARNGPDSPSPTPACSPWCRFSRWQTRAAPAAPHRRALAAGAPPRW